MRPARCLENVAALIDHAKATVRVGLQDAAELAQVRADAQTCDRASSNTTPSGGRGCPRAGHRARKSTSARSWSGRDLALIPALAYRQRALCRPRARSGPA